ncbi:MAG TPA: type I methionyl aminopeptidase [Spirochaetota bacterium]|nr:type I methionyl aminopeptidase [Spirochaetota bacterium]
MRSGIIKSSDDIKRIAEAGAVLRALFEVLYTLDLEGLSTWKVDSVVENFINSHGGRPSFLTLPGYRFASCISVNDEVVHGIPSKKKIIKSGDIVSIDAGVVKNGYFADACRTFTIGSVNEELHYLVEANRSALKKAVSVMEDGAPLNAIGNEISAFAIKSSLVILDSFTGHGVGYALHEEPVVFHGAGSCNDLKLRSGMVLAVEPVMAFKNCKYQKLDDGWTVKTVDGSPTSQFEDTIAITENGPVVLT